MSIRSLTQPTHPHLPIEEDPTSITALPVEVISLIAEELLPSLVDIWELGQSYPLWQKIINKYLWRSLYERCFLDIPTDSLGVESGALDKKKEEMIQRAAIRVQRIASGKLTIQPSPPPLSNAMIPCEVSPDLAVWLKPYSRQYGNFNELSLWNREYAQQPLLSLSYLSFYRYPHIENNTLFYIYKTEYNTYTPHQERAHKQTLHTIQHISLDTKQTISTLCRATHSMFKKNKGAGYYNCEVSSHRLYLIHYKNNDRYSNTIEVCHLPVVEDAHKIYIVVPPSWAQYEIINPPPITYARIDLSLICRLHHTIDFLKELQWHGEWLAASCNTCHIIEWWNIATQAKQKITIEEERSSLVFTLTATRLFAVTSQWKTVGSQQKPWLHIQGWALENGRGLCSFSPNSPAPCETSLQSICTVDNVLFIQYPTYQGCARGGIFSYDLTTERLLWSWFFDPSLSLPPVIHPYKNRLIPDTRKITYLHYGTLGEIAFS